MLDLIERERLNRLLRQQRQIAREINDPFVLPEQEFQKHFRLSKELFENLCSVIIPLMEPSARTTRIRPELRILAALALYAAGSYQRGTGGNMHLGLSQSAMCLCLAEVTTALNTREILLRYIKFPTNAEERQNVMRRFYELHRFPGVVGCIDGTHVAIIRPSEFEEAYFNRKHYHSVNTMIICDADLNILHVDASFPGASHDSHVWNSSRLKAHMENLHEAGENCWLLGDSGYAQRPFLMTPILGAAPGSPEDRYTTQLCSARNTVERCIGVLKARWRCLLAHRTLHYHPIKVGKIINACVVLHNMCNAARIAVPEMPEEDRRRDAERQIHRAVVDALPIGRDQLVERLWQNQ